MSKIPYESIVGSLMYLMIYTRPNIAHAVGKINKYMTNPCKVHWEDVKWILRYIKGTIDFGILFDSRATNSTHVLGFVDANYAQDLDKRRSTTGYVFTLAGGCIS